MEVMEFIAAVRRLCRSYKRCTECPLCECGCAILEMNEGNLKEMVDIVEEYAHKTAKPEEKPKVSGNDIDNVEAFRLRDRMRGIEARQDEMEIRLDHLANEVNARLDHLVSEIDAHAIAINQREDLTGDLEIVGNRMSKIIKRLLDVEETVEELKEAHGTEEE